MYKPKEPLAVGDQVIILGNAEMRHARFERGVVKAFEQHMADMVGNGRFNERDYIQVHWRYGEHRWWFKRNQLLKVR